MSADPRIVPLAVPLARRALAAEGDKVRAHRTLGRALHANGDLAGADAAFDRAVDLDPLSVGSRLMRAVYRLPRLVRTEGPFAGAAPDQIVKAEMIRKADRDYTPQTMPDPRRP